MASFLIGLLVGLIIGGCLGVLVAALAVAAARNDEAAEQLMRALSDEGADA